MPFGNELRRYRIRNGISQEAVGDATYISQKVVSQMERGERSPEPSFLRHLRSAFPSGVEFHAQAVFEEQSEFVAVPLLNNVDNHVQTVLDTIIQEYAEGIRAAKDLKQLCRNRLSAKNILPDMKIQMMADMDQIVDTYTANKVLMVVMAEAYDLSIDELERRHQHKLTERGYYRPER